MYVCFGRCKAGWRSKNVRYRFFRGRIECGRLSDGPCIKLSQYILGGEHIFLLDLLDHQTDKAVQIVGEMQVPVIHQVDAQLAVDLPVGKNSIRFSGADSRLRSMASITAAEGQMVAMGFCAQMSK